MRGCLEDDAAKGACGTTSDPWRGVSAAQRVKCENILRKDVVGAEL